MNELIRQVAALMDEQAAAYSRLESATTQLSAALVRGEPDHISNITRTGENELLRMRVRLLSITANLTKFAEARSLETEKIPLDAVAREKFEAAAKSLLEKAHSYKKIHGRAASLALGGSSFATACIQMCGVPPSTYRAPVLKNNEEQRDLEESNES